MTIRPLILAASILASSAEATTYLVNISIGDTSVIGSIDTDSAIGNILDSDITAFSFKLSKPGYSGLLDNTVGEVHFYQNYLVASDTGLTYDFGKAGDGAFVRSNQYQQVAFNSLCFAGVGFTCFGSPASSLDILANSSFPLASQSMAGVQTVAFVSSNVPEPASWAMFIGGFGLIGATMRRKKAAVSFA